jgi:hypothetical protein
MWKKRKRQPVHWPPRKGELRGFISCGSEPWCRDCPEQHQPLNIGPRLRKIVISTQADYCAEHFPLWYHWYVNVQQVDDIFIIAAGTPQASVETTMAFYQGLPKIHIERMDLPNFEIPLILERHRNWARELRPEPPFLVVSADSDQYFEFPVTVPPNRGLLFFEDVELASESIPPLDMLRDADIRELSVHWRDHVSPGTTGFQKEHRVGLLNTTNCPNVGGGGHCWPPELPARPFERSYHWIFGGAEQFVRKVKALSLQSGDVNWWHWPKWIAVYQAEGEAGLRALYPEIIAQERKSNNVQAFKNRILRS